MVLAIARFLFSEGLMLFLCVESVTGRDVKNQSFYWFTNFSHKFHPGFTCPALGSQMESTLNGGMDASPGENRRKC
jgi:hypothetical protein